VNSGRAEGRKIADLASLVLILAGIFRIASTWTTFSATADEPMHVSAGLELYTQHRYTYQPENPPLPRLAFALGPFLTGVEFDPTRDQGEQLLRVFHTKGHYVRNLVVSRAGNLVFYLIASLSIWLAARREIAPEGALLATFLFTAQPVVIGFFTFATHDGAALAGVALALLALLAWLDRPSANTAVALGAAMGFAVLCKFSALGYVPAACGAMYAVAIVRSKDVRQTWRRHAWTATLAIAIAAGVVWAGYGLRLGRVGDLGTVAEVLGSDRLRDWITRHPDVRVPAPHFLLGIAGLLKIDRSSQWPGFLLGHIGWTGWWWYFPVALALKTTLASLFLWVGSMAARTARLALMALAASAAILAVSMTSHLNLGVRYVLPIYAPLSLAAATTLLHMFRSGRRALIIAATALLLWHAGASLAIHPDSFTYFNEVAARRPWLYLGDSNLDWGQDVLRLKRVVKEKRIDKIGVNIMGWHDFDALGFPPSYRAERNVPSQGWVAVSEFVLHFYEFKWLRGRPYQRVGRSIRLYYVR